MARTGLLASLASGAACALAGCGTVRNLQGDGGHQTPQVYGGVAADLKAVRDVANEEPPRIHGWLPGLVLACHTVRAVRCCRWLADVPLSAVGDTLTLPWVALAELSTTDCATPPPNANESEPGDEDP